MSASLTSLAYLVAAVLFILALRGLSSPVTSRQGNRFGMIGMAVAVVATLLHHGMGAGGFGLIFLGLVIGGGVGVGVALRIQMTALPQLVAAFHSLVGLAAVFVAAAALNAPEAFGIGVPGAIHAAKPRRDVARTGHRRDHLLRLADRLRQAAGADEGRADHLPRPALSQPGPGDSAAGAGGRFVATGGSQVLFWLIALLALALGFLIIIPIGGADMPVVVSMLNSYSGWAAAGIGFTIQNLALIITGSLVGASGAILSYIMCKGMNRSIINVLLGGFGTESGTASAAGPAGDRSVRPATPTTRRSS